jgi:hypothetical protein
VTQVDEQSHAEKRLGLEAAILRISRNREAMNEGLFLKLSHVPKQLTSYVANTLPLQTPSATTGQAQW